MRLRFVLVAAAALLVASPAVSAQSGAEGASVSSGRSSQSAKISTSGPASVGVVQGVVAEGSRSWGSSGAPGEGQGGGSGTTASTSAPPANATQGGAVAQLDLPVLGGSLETSATQTRPDFVALGAVVAVLIGLVVLYRRLPRPTAA